MAIVKPPRPRLSIRVHRAQEIADVEYRVTWNEAAQGRDAVRNGAATEVRARKKKKSAIDSTIRDAKAELKTSATKIIVTSLEDRKLETV